MCVFCDIIKGEIPAKKVFENERFIIINDIMPIANCHYLAIPKNHYKELGEMQKEDRITLLDIFSSVPQMKEQLGLANGYRLVINQGDDAGQSVPHLHVHILGGEKLGWEK